VWHVRVTVPCADVPARATVNGYALDMPETSTRCQAALLAASTEEDEAEGAVGPTAAM
jgi:hypothetical protein